MRSTIPVDPQVSQMPAHGIAATFAVEVLAHTSFRVKVVDFEVINVVRHELEEVHNPLPSAPSSERARSHGDVGCEKIRCAAGSSAFVPFSVVALRR